MAKREIKSANAEYTGGGIYILYGQFEDGSYFMSFPEDNCTEVFDADGSNFDESLYPEWMDEHRIESIVEKENVHFTYSLLGWIEEYEPTGNYSMDDITTLRSIYMAAISMELVKKEGE